MKKLFLYFAFLFIAVQVSAQIQPICATPGADGAQSLTTAANTFFPSKSGNATLDAGAKTVELAAVPPPFTVGGNSFSFGTSQITKGNLLLIIQMQGADINSDDNSNYGSGIAGNIGSGAIASSIIAGQYEYIVALNDVTTAGGTLEFKAAGAGGGLVHSYINANATTSAGQKRYQIVRLMQFSNLTMTNDIKTIPWNGSAGGLIALDVAGTLNMNGKTIDASITGFRGGYLLPRSAGNNRDTYRTTDSKLASTKGEGIAGTPRFMWDGYNEVDNGASWLGYPSGDYGRGAPANAGGGGNNHNAGGGGGGNGSAGGAGGHGWNSGSNGPYNLAGGRPGSALAASLGRLYLGGGGGGGDANDATNGVKGGVGGGIVIITANKIVGRGTIFANGGRGEAGRQGSSADGAGGGGAGGTIFINVNQPSPTANLSISAQGGNGGNAFTTTPHGPGGGGGGGVIHYKVPNAAVHPDVRGGLNGKTNDGAGGPHGAEAGETPGIVNTFSQADLPPELQGVSSTCLPELTVHKSRLNTTVPVPAGSTTEYTIVVTNSGGGAEGVKIQDHLPSGFTFVSATVIFSTHPTEVSSTQNIGTVTEPEFGAFNILGNSSVTIKMTVSIPSSTAPGIYHNPAYVSYLDPQRNISDPNRTISPALNALENANTTYQSENATPGSPVGGSNYDLDQPDEDVLVVKPELTVTKTVNEACIDVVNGNTYTIIVKNEGSTASPVTITDVIPNGLNVEGTTHAGWNQSISGRTYVFTLANLAPGQSSSPITIRVKPASGATQANWSNTATEASGANATVLLYANPTKATATASIASACNDGTFFMEGNQPTIGKGEWTFIGDPGNTIIVNPSQYNTAITGVEKGKDVKVRWTITNGSCESYAEVILVNNSILPTAALRTKNDVSSEVCVGSPLPDLEVVLTGTAPWTITYLDHTGETITKTGITSSPYIIPNSQLGIYSLKTVKDNSGCFGNASGSIIFAESPATVGGSVASNQTICIGEIPAALILSGHVGDVVIWQFSTDNANWETVATTENLTTYTPGALFETTYFRAIVQSGGCLQEFSTPVEITVNELPTEADAGQDQTQYNSGVFTLNGNAPTVGTGVWTVVSGTANIVTPADRNSKVTIDENSSATLRWTITNGLCAVSVDEVVLAYTKAAALEVVKTVSKATAFAGESLTYTVTVINRGPSDAGEVTISDAVPAELKGVTWTAAASGASTVVATSGGGNNNISLGANIKAGEENKVVLTITGKINAALASTEKITIENDATVAPTDTDFPPATSVKVPTEISNKSDLEINKVGPSKANAGEEIEYTLIIKNNGPSNAVGAVISDEVPAGIDPVSWTSSVTGAAVIVGGGTGNVNAVSVIGNIPAGTGNSIIITIKGTIKPDFAGVSLENTALMTPSEPGNNPIESNTIITTVSKKANLSISKTGPTSAVAGDKITYTVNVKNDGPSDLEGVSIDDTLPTAVIDATWTVAVQGGAVPDLLNGNGTVALSADMPTGSKVVITIEGTIDPSYTEAETENTASATPKETIDNTPVTSTKITSIARVANVRISKAGPQVANAGEEIQYTLEIRNSGPSNAIATLINDVVPAEVTVSKWTATATGEATATLEGGGNINGVEQPASNTIRFLSDIPSGTGLVTVVITGITASGLGDKSTITNTATATIGPGITDPDLSDNSASAITTVDLVNEFKVSKSGPSSVNIGDPITYTIIVRNTGGSDIANAALIDYVPTEVEVTSWEVIGHGGAIVSSGFPASSSASGADPDMNIIKTELDIPNGAEHYIELLIKGIVQVTTSTEFENEVSVLAAGNEQSAIKTSVNQSTDLVITKNGPQTIAAGEDITYTIVVRNNGPVNVKGLKIVDAVPLGIENVTWTASAKGDVDTKVIGDDSGSGNAIEAIVDIVAGAGNEIKIIVTGKVPSNTNNMPSLVNTASIDLTGTGATDYNLSNNTSTVTTNIINKAALLIKKTGPHAVIAGESIEYNLTIRNNGPSDAKDVTITDVIPAEINNVTWTAIKSGDATITSALSGTDNNLAVEGTIPFGAANYITVKITGTVDASFEEELKNTAKVKNGGEPEVPSEDVVTEVSREPKLTIVKTGDANVRAGESIEYQITVINNGPSDAIGTIISDDVPIQIENVEWSTQVTDATISNGGTGTGNTLSVTADIKAGGSIVITINGTVNANAKGNIENTAWATPKEPGTIKVPSDPVYTFIQSPSISLVKTGALSADQKTIKYTFTVKNTGNVTLDPVTISDVKIPDGIVLSTTTLIPGQSASATAIYTISQAEKDAGIIKNTATAMGKPPLGTDVSDISGTDEGNDTETEITFPRNPELTVTKKTTSVWPYNTLGQEITYDIIVKNTGNVTIKNIVLKDDNAVLVTAGEEQIGTLLPGELKVIKVVHEVTLADLDKGMVTNQAFVNGDDPEGPITEVPSNDPDTPKPNDPTETLVEQNPKFTVIKEITSSGPYNKVDQEIVYNITVTNTGNVTLKNLVIRDDNAVIQAGEENIGSLAPTEKKTIIVTHKITQEDLDAGSISNQAFVKGSGPKGPLPELPSNDPKTPEPNDPTDIDILQSGVLTLTKESVAGIYTEVGDVIDYRLVLTNTGNVTIKNIVITDNNADVGSVTPSTIVELKVGASVNITAKHTITQIDLDKGGVYNIAEATGKGPKDKDVTVTSNDPNPLDPTNPNNPAVDPNCPTCTITRVDPPIGITLVKTVSNQGSGANGLFILGDEIEYSFTITNIGRRNLTSIVLNDDLLNKGVITIPGTLAPGASIIHKEKYTITAEDAKVGKVINSAIVKAKDPQDKVVEDISGSSTDNDIPTITVVGEGPKAVDDETTTWQNVPVIIEVLNNDTKGSAEIDLGSIVITKQPENGTLTVHSNGTITYTPNDGYTGEDVFSYTVTDKNGVVSNVADVKVTINGTKPKATDDRAETEFNKEVKIPVLDNDSGNRAELDPSSIIIKEHPKNGILRSNADGTVTYIPNPGFTGEDGFSYTVKDVNGNETNVAYVVIQVTGFFIPNVFTPNGDGKNDVFEIVGLEKYDHAEVTIFNRWGNEVYRNRDYRNNWDGNNLNEGTYYYLVVLKKEGKESAHKGWVLLKR